MEIIDHEDGTASVIIGTTSYPFPNRATAEAYVAAVAGTMNPDAAMAEWEEGVKGLLKLAEQFIVRGKHLEIVYEQNELLQRVLAATPGEKVAGSTMTQFRALCVGALMQDLLRFLDEPAQGNDPPPFPLPTRLKIIMQRD